MAKYIQANKSYNYYIPFVVDGELVSPTSGNITVTKNDGTNVVNAASLTIPTNATSVVYPIPNTANQITLPYELRYIHVEFIYNGNTYYLDDFYTLRASLRMPVTTNMVRNLLSLSDQEMPDGQIDLYAAYSDVQSDIASSGLVLDTLIAQGSTLIPTIQEAVAIKAALNSAGILQLNVYQSEQADNTVYKRFANIDLDTPIANLQDRYAGLLIDLTGVDVSVEVEVQRFIVFTGTDPVTGE